MSSTKIDDEQPKRRIARKVVSEKRQYFVPEHNVTVEAATAEEAGRKAGKLSSHVVEDVEEEGDG